MGATVGQKETRARGELLVALSAVFFGAMAIFAKTAYAERMDWIDVLATRFPVAAAAMWLWAAVTRSQVRVAAKDLVNLFFLGFVGYGVTSAFYFTSLLYVPAAVAGVCLYTYPALVAFLGATLFHESLGLAGSAALVVATAGAILVAWAPGVGSVDVRGVALGFGAALSYSVYVLWSARVGRRVGPVALTAYLLTAAAFFYLLLAAATRGGGLAPPPNGRAWAAIVGLAILSTTGAIGFFQAGLRQVGPSRLVSGLGRSSQGFSLVVCSGLNAATGSYD